MPRVVPKNLTAPQGRSSDAYRTWLRARIAARKHQKAVEAVLEDDTHTHFATITQFAHKMAHGAPVQMVVTEDVTPGAALTGEVVVRQLLAALPLLLAGHPALAAGLTGQQAVDAEFTVEE